MKTLRLPRLGTTMEEGTIVTWHVSPGAKVEPGDVLYEVTTDKVNMEVESDHSGEIMELLIPEGTTVKVGDDIAVVKGEEWPEQNSDKLVEPEGNQNPQSNTLVNQEHNQGQVASSGSGTASESMPSTSSLRASPAARRLARDLAVNLHEIQGTGPGGRVTRRDIERDRRTLTPNVQKETIPDRDGRVIPFTGPKALAVRRLEESARIPQVTLHASARATKLLKAHNTLRTTYKTVSIIDFVLLAVCRSLKTHSELNGWIEDNSFRSSTQVNLGYAVDNGEGLYVVTILEAEKLTLHQISQKRRELTEHVRNHSLRPEYVQLPSFTVSNLGPFGVESFNPLLYPPQVGILGVGTIITYHDGPYLSLDLTFDHRALDGASAAISLQAIKKYVEQPLLLL